MAEALTLAQPVWRPRLIKAGIALSLALNVFTIGGFIFARLFLPDPFGPPERRLEMLASRLSLTPEQHQAFEGVTTAMHHAHDELESQNRPIFQKAWDNLASDKPDAGAVRDLIAQMAQNRQHFLKTSSDSVLDFIVSLNFDQRQRLSQIVSSPHDPAGGTLRHSLGN